MFTLLIVQQPLCLVHLVPIQQLEQYCEAVVVICVSKMNKLKIREFLSHEFSLKLNLETYGFPMQ